MRKKTIHYFAILFFILLGFICSGIYLMEIEDHYSDLQEVYFESKTGDLIINKQTGKFGLISKSWKRANIITKQKDTLDLTSFVNENKYEVFRSEKEFNLEELSFEKIINLRDKKLIKSILSN